jgi:hypothetical protein
VTTDKEKRDTCSAGMTRDEQILFWVSIFICLFVSLD